MIKINNIGKEFILDLNDFPYNEHKLKVSSKDEKGNAIPWDVELVSNKIVKADRDMNNTLKITTDVEKLKSDSIIVIRNTAKEIFKITLKYNVVLTREKTYKFKITNKSTEGRKTRIRILSKENNVDTEWECTYDGKPLSYVIKPMSSNKSGYVDIWMKDELYSRINTLIEFTQIKSGNVIKLKLNQGNNDTKIIKAG
jgi:hypothetical protein